MFDGLRNAVTGIGSARDPRTSTGYGPTSAMTQYELANAYRGSGIMRKIVNIPALDMVREWREWQADADQIELIEAEETRLGLLQKIHRAEVLRACGGGALIMGLPGDPSQPAPVGGRKGLAFVNVVSRWHLTFTELNDDASSPGYGEPVVWRMNTTRGEVVIDPSRVIPFRGAMVPPITNGVSQTEEFWGESVIEQTLDAVKDSDTARASFAALLHKARLLRIGIPNLSDIVSTGEGEKAVMSRLSILAMAESIHNASVYDAGNGGSNPGETITDAQYNFTGAKDILNAYAEFVCAVADIPATRLLGRAPDGMNSSGESQQRDWAKKIKAKQELELRPCLARLDVYLLPSALGSTPPGVWWDFNEIDDADETAEATRFKITVEALAAVQNTAAIPDIAFAKAMQNTLVEGGWMPGLDTALEEIPEAERFGITPDLPVDPAVDPFAAAIGDAAPRTLYVQRKLLNGAEFLAWAKSQGFNTTLPANDLHVTVAFSRQPVDWMAIEPSWDGDKGDLIVPPGGARLVESLGDKGAVVLLFSSSSLAYRHEAIRRAGASWDYPEYQPHVSITYSGEGIDLSKVDPFQGALHFGPEIFEELNDDWASSIAEV
jgi:phage-related protein (TIGR01555 family)